MSRPGHRTIPTPLAIGAALALAACSNAMDTNVRVGSDTAGAPSTGTAAAVSPTTAPAAPSTVAPVPSSPPPEPSGPAATASAGSSSSATFTVVSGGLAYAGDNYASRLAGDGDVLAAVASAPGADDSRDQLLAVSTDHGRTWTWTGRVKTGRVDRINDLTVSGTDILLVGWSGDHDTDGATVVPLMWLASGPEYVPRQLRIPASLSGHNAHLVSTEVLSDGTLVIFGDEEGRRGSFMEDYLVTWTSTDAGASWTRRVPKTGVNDFAVRDTVRTKGDTIELVGIAWNDKDNSYNPAWLSSPDGGRTYRVHGDRTFLGTGDDGADRVVAAPDGTLAILGYRETGKDEYDSQVWLADPASGSLRLLDLVQQEGSVLTGEFLTGLLYEGSELVGYGSSAGTEYGPSGDAWLIDADGSMRQTLALTVPHATVHVSDIGIFGDTAVVLGDARTGNDVDVTIWAATEPDA